MGGCISNSCRVTGACSKREDSNDRDPTLIRIFGFFTFLFSIVVLCIGAASYAYCQRKSIALDLGFSYILPCGGFWGGIFSLLTGFMAMFHGIRLPFGNNLNRRGDFYRWGLCYPCSCAKLGSFFALVSFVIASAAAIWDIYMYLQRLRLGLTISIAVIITGVFNALIAMNCLIIFGGTIVQHEPCCSCCWSDYDRRYEGYEMDARDFFSYKNTMAGFGGNGGAGLFGTPPPPPVRHNIRDQTFGPKAGTPVGPPVPAGPPVLVTLSPPKFLPPVVVTQPGVAPVHGTLSDYRIYRRRVCSLSRRLCSGRLAHFLTSSSLRLF